MAGRIHELPIVPDRRLAFVGGMRRDVDQCFHLRIVTGMRDDSTPVAMADQHHRTCLQGQYPLHGRHIRLE
jgi:hypothetical protein